jgi:hypothetical protein
MKKAIILIAVAIMATVSGAGMRPMVTIALPTPIMIGLDIISVVFDATKPASPGLDVSTGETVWTVNIQLMDEDGNGVDFRKLGWGEAFTISVAERNASVTALGHDPNDVKMSITYNGALRSTMELSVQHASLTKIADSVNRKGTRFVSVAAKDAWITEVLNTLNPAP